MSDKDNVKNFGRVRYVEPNDFFGTTDNTTHPYEDYAIYVDLTVNIPNRYGSATDEYNNEIILGSYSTDSLSFFGGTDGFLTDNPSGITYTDIINNNTDGMNESLGITSIHISYNSYFYPTVTIQFSDVRGSALMGAHEENYRRSMINQAQNKRVYDKKVASFFSSLFSFPYPEFKLKVKGFYGMKVEYSLLVSNFSSSFNNNTGNFDCTVSFIGKMYGLYTDIPMSYLLIAPYCRYGTSDGKTIWESKNYTFHDNESIEIPKFLDLQKSILSANQNIAKTFDNKTTEEYSKLGIQTNLLQTISSNLNNLKSVLHTAGEIIEDSVTFFIGYSEDNGKCLYYNPNNTSNIDNCIKKLYEAIQQYRTETNTNLPGLYDLKGEWNKAVESISDDKLITIKKDNEKWVIAEDLSKNENFNKNIKLPNDNIKFGRGLTGCSTQRSDKYLVLSCKLLTEELHTLITNNKNKQVKIEKKVMEESSSYVARLLGFEPTIKNIFNILMAHLDCFMTLFYELISNTTGVNRRTIKEYGFHVDNTTDLPDNNLSSSEIIIPPFPGLKNHENTFCYPTSFNLKKEMEETKFIDALLSSNFDFMDNLDDLNKLAQEYKNESAEFIPTCISDFILQINPYAQVFDTNNGNIDIDWIFTFFGIRCILKYAIERGDITMPEDVFGKLEAYNFWRKNSALNKNTINKLKSPECNANNFINFLLGGENNVSPNPYYINGNPCYRTDALKNLLVLNSANKLTIPYNYPCLLGRDALGINGFITDIDDKTGRYSFKSEDTVAYEAINFIEPNVLNEWNNKLNTIDLNKYCGDNEAKYDKNRIIYNYTNTPQGLYEVTNVHSLDIRYRKSEINKFMTEYSSMDSYTSDGHKSLKEASDSIFQDIRIDSISSSVKKEPFFLSMSDENDDNITAENFLLSLPHNWVKLANEIMEGRTIATLPYPTYLTIGLLIQKLKTIESRTDFAELIQKLGTDFIRSLKVTACLTRDKDGNICDELLNMEDVYYANDALIDEIFGFKKYFVTDFLSLSDEYTKWANNINVGGFEYFKRQYSLTDNIVEDNNIKYLWSDKDALNTTIDASFGETTSKRLLNALRYIQKNEDGNFSEYMNTDGKKILNTAFREVYGNKKSSTPFTDRYTRISYINDKSWFFSDTFGIFLTFNENFEAYKPLSDFFTTIKKLVVPYQINKDKTQISRYSSYKRDRTIERDILVSSFNSFKNMLLELYQEVDEATGLPKEETYASIYNVNEDAKLSMYQTLKNLYDKHLSTITADIEKYRLDSEKSEFKRFHFIDSLYNDISDKLFFNMTKTFSLIDSICNEHGSFNTGGSMNSEMSVYSFMSKICEEHYTMLLAVPIFNWYDKDCTNGLMRMFKPLTYNECIDEKPLYGPSYICFYPHQASKHLDTENNQYKDDGFDIVDMNDTGSFEGPMTVPDLMNTEDNKYVVPAFGVEYGSQKQSIFKNINVNMDNPQITEASAANLFELVKQNNEDPRKLVFEGQDLYKIYSNYSYTCQVEMMGCAQIQPLMYFQLNNVPMFRGAYQIIQVEHNIVPGNMTTSFKGVRINRTKIPMTRIGSSVINVKDVLNGAATIKIDNIYQKMDIKKITPDNSKVGMLEEEMNITAEKLSNDYNEHVSFSAGQKEGFNKLNPKLRQLVYCIVGDLKELSSKTGYTLGVCITSTARDSSTTSKTSDHYIGNGGSPSERRKQLGYEKLGCAIDMQGTKNGVIDLGEPTITIYTLIATIYHEYCRQLIWEQDTSYGNRIRVIHLASYGKRGENGSDKTEIFHGAYPTGNKSSEHNLPSEFLAIAEKLVNEDSVKLANFSKRPTADEINKKYEEASGLA